jgi:hypothetical protein
MLILALALQLASDGPRHIEPSELLTTPEAVELRIASPQRKVLVGEPLRLHGTWIQKQAGYVSWESEDFTAQSLALAVDDGKTLRIYREAPHEAEPGPRILASTPAGTTAAFDYVFLTGRDYVGPGPDKSSGWNPGFRALEGDTCVFPAKGRYRVWAVLLSEAGQPTEVRSNTLAFTVSAPSSEELKVLNVLRAAPRRFRGEDDGPEYPLARLLRERPHSPYLQWARLKWLERDLERPGRGADRSARRLERRAFLRSKAQEAMSDGWGPFEDLALAVASELAAAADDTRLAQEVRSRLLSRFPDSPAARRLQTEAQ